MNIEMAYLIGMILGNGEVQRGRTRTKVTIDIPHKNIISDDKKDIQIYVKASLIDIERIIGPIIGTQIEYFTGKKSTKIYFEKNNDEYIIRELLRLIQYGTKHSNMSFADELFNMNRNEKKSLMIGFSDVTAYIRKSNIAFGKPGQHRVYIEIPGNWGMVIDVANMLKTLDIPVQNIDFGHPNCRDSSMKKYNEGKPNYWKKEHQIKIWANEFLTIGFNVKHKQSLLEKYSNELLNYLDPKKTHLFYWEKPFRRRVKQIHPCENDLSLPFAIRGKHFDSWTQLAKELGYCE